MAGHIVLPWIHRVFALMKRWGLGTYHGLRRKHIDTYLNEFVFRYNRRFYRHVSFETMLGLASHHHPTSYSDIVDRNNTRQNSSHLVISYAVFCLKNKPTWAHARAPPPRTASARAVVS